MPHLVCVRAHFLDQDGPDHLPSRAPRQAGFSLHNDKPEEIYDPVADDVAADSTTGFRNSSVLFTMVVRLGGAKGPSALQVLGYPPAHMDHPGESQLFLSLLQHTTAVLGGHKVAFFLGYHEPLLSEERFARLQVWPK